MNLLSLSLLTLAVMTFISCSKKIGESADVSTHLKRSMLVGSWSLREGEDELIYTFKANGEMRVNGESFEELIAQDEGGPFTDGDSTLVEPSWYFARLDETYDVIIMRGLKSQRYEDISKVTIDGDEMRITPFVQNRDTHKLELRADSYVLKKVQE